MVEVFLLPKSYSLVQINCPDQSSLILVVGLCTKSGIDGWRRFELTIIMTWDVYQFIAYNGLGKVYDKEYARGITTNDYD